MPALVLEAVDYKDFIRRKIDDNKAIRGYQSRLAEAARCQKSFLSQVLHGERHLSTEQAARLTAYWALADDEAEYFVRLVELAQVRYPHLRQVIERRLKGIKAERENLAKRFEKTETWEAIDHHIYYSSWHYSALHILVGIDGFHTVDALAARLRLPSQVIEDSLGELLRMNLVKTNGRHWDIKPGHFFLPKDSPWGPLNHANWRHRAVQDAQLKSTDGLHYTVVNSHSEEDLAVIKNILLEALDKSRKIVRASANEELSALCLDFFRVR